MFRQLARRFATSFFVALVGAPSAVMGQEARFPDPFPSTYQPFPSQTTVIQNATILTGTGQRINGGSVVMQGAL